VNRKLQDSVPQVDLKQLTAKMSELSWRMLHTVPPVVSTTITDSPFSSEWHDKEMKPLWNNSLQEPHYELVYYRPILFYSYEGKVMQKGWVGNKKLFEDMAEGKNLGSFVRATNGTSGTSGVKKDNCPYGYPKNQKLYKSCQNTHENNGANPSNESGLELLNLDPETSRIRDLETTVLNPYVSEEEKNDDESAESAEELQPEPIGLRKFM